MTHLVWCRTTECVRLCEVSDYRVPTEITKSDKNVVYEFHTATSLLLNHHATLLVIRIVTRMII